MESLLIIVVFLLFGMLVIGILNHLEFKRFVEHICKPIAPMPMMSYPPRKKNKIHQDDDLDNKEPVGFRPPPKKETTE